MDALRISNTSGVKMNRIWKSVATFGAAALIGGLLVTQPISAVQPTLSKNDTFTFLLNAADYWYGSPRDDIELAKDMCRDLKKKKKASAKREVAETYKLAMKFGAGWSQGQISEFTSIALTVYCLAQFRYSY
jgi:hypothetical protein